MPMTRIELPAAPPDHQGTDGGAAGGGGRWGSPLEGVPGEAAQIGLHIGRQGGGPEACNGSTNVKDTLIYFVFKFIVDYSFLL